MEEDKDPEGVVYYLPHQAIIKEDRLTMKVRIVFDASSHGREAQSLNDCLHTGPNLMPDILQLLIKFRKHKIALLADLEKAFLQVGLSTKDRDATRFLLGIDRCSNLPVIPVPVVFKLKRCRWPVFHFFFKL